MLLAWDVEARKGGMMVSSNARGISRTGDRFRIQDT